MKTIKTSVWLSIALTAILLISNPLKQYAQDQKNAQVLDQNITLYAEDEPLSDVIEKICDYLNINYSYNSALVEGKKITLNVSNKPIKHIFDQLMKDFYLIFEIEDNILVVRDYVPLKESIDYERDTRNFANLNKGFHFINPKKKSISLKFKSASNLIIIPVTINNSDTLNFILDTGVRYPIITELPFVNKLNLNYLKPVKIKGLGEGVELTAYKSGNNKIQIKGMVANNQEVQMIIDENFQISHILGIPVHGLIGLNLFKDYIVKIDYINERIHLYKPEYYKYRDRKKDIVMPIHFEANKPYVRTSIVMHDLTEVPVKLLIDTGASDAIWLSTKSDNRIKLPERHVETFLGTGLNGDIYGKKGRIGGIWVGPLILPEPIVAFPESELIDRIITSNDRNGTLGAEILRRFTVTIDYRNKRLTLHPTSKIKDPFNYNMSGMEVINPIPGLPIFTVTNIRKDSPAFFAGIKEDDQILSVNHLRRMSLSLNDIHLLFQSKEDKKIKIRVLRDGEEIQTSFVLKKLF
ncbi:hypothetical protein MNBD_BACTEROID01-1068 [hydrothermal vent metagenome]|uniref:PDZ domain-containing protein n=1 Tax=hydrothermal vent metagenome TaxID=652676 RepID=A0A3B0UFU2_9ZZZZ